MSERDPTVDPHLLAALRHAPDRSALPPPAVTARILAAARDAARPPAAASPWRRLGAWLVQPQVGAAFATLAVATLLGVMWSAHEPAPSPTTSAVAEVTAAPAASTPIVQAPPATAPPAPAAARRVAKLERQRAETREAGAKAAVEAAPPPAAPADALAKADAAPPAPVPTPAAAAPVPAAAPPAARSERVLTNEAGAPTAGRAAPSAALALADRAPSFDPLQGLEADGAAAWTWHVSGPSGAVGDRAHGTAQQALWAALRQATQGRWQAAAPRRPGCALAGPAVGPAAHVPVLDRGRSAAPDRSARPRLACGGQRRTGARLAAGCRQLVGGGPPRRRDCR